MKILMLIDSLEIGGAETHTITLAKEISRKGHKVEVVSAGGKLLQKLRDVGIKHTKIPNICANTRKNAIPLPIRLLVARNIICRNVRPHRPDVVHAHTRRMAFLARGICRAEKIPLVTTAHAKFSMRAPKRALSKWGDGTIAVSEDIKNHLLANTSIPPQQIKVIFNGIEIPN